MSSEQKCRSCRDLSTLTFNKLAVCNLICHWFCTAKRFFFLGGGDIPKFWPSFKQLTVFSLCPKVYFFLCHRKLNRRGRGRRFHLLHHGRRIIAWVVDKGKRLFSCSWCLLNFSACHYAKGAFYQTQYTTKVHSQPHRFLRETSSVEFLPLVLCLGSRMMNAIDHLRNDIMQHTRTPFPTIPEANSMWIRRAGRLTGSEV